MSVFHLTGIIIGLVLLIITGCTEPKPKINKQFDRTEFNMVIKEYDNFRELRRATEEKDKDAPGLHRGLAVWYEEGGKPVGTCTIYVVKDTPKVFTHEVNHCRWGSYHP